MQGWYCWRRNRLYINEVVGIDRLVSRASYCAHERNFSPAQHKLGGEVVVTRVLYHDKLILYVNRFLGVASDTDPMGRYRRR